MDHDRAPNTNCGQCGCGAGSLTHLQQGLWRIEYLNTGRANSLKIWLFSLVPVAPQVGVVVAN